MGDRWHAETQIQHWRNILLPKRSSAACPLGQDRLVLLWDSPTQFPHLAGPLGPMSYKRQIKQLGLNVDPLCLLCNTDHESRNHLFFECSYSTIVWRQIANRCDLQPLTSWDAIVLQLQSLRSNRDSMQLTQLATQASIYWLWSEQNSRLHNRNFKSPEVIVFLIDKQIRNRLQSFRHSRASSAMTQLWFLRT